jgi:hypothetical protein
MENNFSDDLFFQTRLQASITGELRGKALEDLNATIASSPEAADEARFSHKLAEVLRHEDKFQMSAFIGAIIAEEGLPPAPAKLKVGTGLAKLAGIILLLTTIGGAYFYFTSISNPTTTRTDLFEQHYTHLENVIVTPDNPTGLEQFDQGMAAYDRADYPQAIALLSDYYRQSGDANAALFLGVSHLEMNNAQAAAEALQNCIGKLQPPALDACQWYLALAYLKAGDTGLAKGLLNTLSKDGVYGKKAEGLLKKMVNLND